MEFSDDKGNLICNIFTCTSHPELLTTQAKTKRILYITCIDPVHSIMFKLTFKSGRFGSSPSAYTERIWNSIIYNAKGYLSEVYFDVNS